MTGVQTCALPILLCFDSPIAIALTGIFTTVCSCFINAYPNKKLIGYSYWEQMKDILPSFLTSLSMFVIIILVGKIQLGVLLTLVLQVIIGIIYYLIISVLFRLEPFKLALELLLRIKK